MCVEPDCMPLNPLVHLLQLPCMLWTLCGVPAQTLGRKAGSKDAQPWVAMLGAAAPCIASNVTGNIVHITLIYIQSTARACHYALIAQALCSSARSIYAGCKPAAVRRRMSHTAQSVGPLRQRPCRSLAITLTRHTWARGPACRPARATGAPRGCSRRRRAPLPPPRSAAPPRPACINWCSQII